MGGQNAPLYAVILGCVMVVGLTKLFPPVRAETRREDRVLLFEPVKPYSKISEPLYKGRTTKVEFRVAKDQRRKPARYARRSFVKREISSVKF